MVDERDVAAALLCLRGLGVDSVERPLPSLAQPGVVNRGFDCAWPAAQPNGGADPT